MYNLTRKLPSSVVLKLDSSLITNALKGNVIIQRAVKTVSDSAVSFRFRKSVTLIQFQTILLSLLRRRYRI